MADSDCPNMTNCEMYRVFTLAGALEVWKLNYCRADYARCERYKRTIAGQPVPVNLMPNGALLRKRA
jgi:hypothetical protein